MLLVLVSWLGSWTGSSFGTGTSWNHKALGENPDAAVSVSLQPFFVHCGDMPDGVSAYSQNQTL